MISKKETPPIEWKDIITLDKFNYFTGNVETKPEVYFTQIEAFFDEFQTTNFGQEKLAQIRQKYGDKKLEISLNDSFQSVTFSNGQISIDVRDEKSLAFLDPNTCEPKEMSIERILTHELIHAADPRIELGKNNQEECHDKLVEEYATTETDKYAKLHAPQFGERAAYSNIVSASEKDNLLKTEQGSAIDLLKNDPSLQEEINDIVINVKSLMESCIDEVKDFNGIKLPISNGIKIHSQDAAQFQR